MAASLHPVAAATCPSSFRPTSQGGASWTGSSLVRSRAVGGTSRIRGKKEVLTSLDGILPAVHAASSSSGLSSIVKQRNNQLRGHLKRALQDDKAKTSGEKWHISSQRRTQQLEDIRRDLQGVEGGISSVREHHKDFMAAQLAHSAELEKKELHAVAQHHVGPGGDAHDAGSPDRHKGNAGTSSPRSASKESKPNSVFKENRSRSQQRAMNQFEAIDEGSVPRDAIFEQVKQDSLRVETKVDFYRDRSRQLLPKVEQRLMRKDPDHGEIIVDVKKLQNCCMWGAMANSPELSPEPRTETALSLSQSIEDFRPGARGQSLSPHGHCWSPHGPRSSPFQDMRLLSSTHTESLARLHRDHEIHMRRVEQVTSKEKDQLLQKRMAMLVNIREKDQRHNRAIRDRQLMTWVIIALAADSFHMAHKFHQTYEEDHSHGHGHEQPKILVALAGEDDLDDEDEANPLRRGERHSQHRLSVNWQKGMAKVKLMNKLKPKSDAHMSLIMASVEKRRLVALSNKKRQKVWVQWKSALRFAIFIVRCKRGLKLRDSAEVIKDFIERTWRGYEIRKNVKNFLKTVYFLQRSFRYCLRLWRSVRHDVIGSVFWEVETEILADIVGMAPESRKKEIEAELEAMDVNGKRAEIQRLVDNRSLFWRGGSLAGRNRRRAFLPKSKTVGGSKFRQGPALGTQTNLAQLTAVSGQEAMHDPRISAYVFRGGRRGAILDEAAEVMEKKKERIPHPLLKIVDQYRIPTNIKQGILIDIAAENKERWWKAYKSYLQQKEQFKSDWELWRLDVAALGPYNRDSWPALPQIPQFPYEMCKVNRNELKKRISAALKSQSEAGQLM